MTTNWRRPEDDGGRRDVFLERSLPHAIECERAVLGAILLDNRLLGAAAERLQPEDLYLEANRLVFRAMIECSRTGSPIDPITLGEELRRTGTFDAAGGGSYISGLIDSIPRLENIDQYAAKVKQAALRREKIAIANRLAADMFEPETDDVLAVDEAVAALCRVNTHGSGGWKRMDEATVNVLAEIEDRACLDRPMPLDTGLTDLDYATGGIEAGDYWIVGGQPGSGKTALATTIARTVASRTRRLRVGEEVVDRPQRVGIFSIDMKFAAIIQRFIAADSGVDTRRMRRATDLTRDERRRVNEAGIAMAHLPIAVCEDPMLTIEQIDARATQLASEGDLALLMVDFVQMVSTKNTKQGMRERIIEVSLGLKTLGKRLGVPIVGLSQVTREVAKRKDDRPEVYDLMESSALEQHADVICLTWRPNEASFRGLQDPEPAFVIVGKQRNGTRGEDVPVTFLPWRTEWRDQG